MVTRGRFDVRRVVLYAPVMQQGSPPDTPFGALDATYRTIRCICPGNDPNDDRLLIGGDDYGVRRHAPCVGIWAEKFCPAEILLREV